MRKERIIFDNYDLDLDDARECLVENGNEDPTQDQIYDEAYWQLETWWEKTESEIEDFFNGELFLDGVINRWNGKQTGFQVFKTFEELFSWVTKDCDYWKIWDENGHMFLTCSHHDGTNLFEIREMTAKGSDYFYNWEYGMDNRNSSFIHDQLRKRYTKLPRYAEKQFGCKAREYVKEESK